MTSHGWLQRSQRCWRSTASRLISPRERLDGEEFSAKAPTRHDGLSPRGSSPIPMASSSESSSEATCCFEGVGDVGSTCFGFDAPPLDDDFFAGAIHFAMSANLGLALDGAFTVGGGHVGPDFFTGTPLGNLAFSLASATAFAFSLASALTRALAAFLPSALGGGPLGPANFALLFIGARVRLDAAGFLILGTSSASLGSSPFVSAPSATLGPPATSGPSATAGSTAALPPPPRPRVSAIAATSDASSASWLAVAAPPSRNVFWLSSLAAAAISAASAIARSTPPRRCALLVARPRSLTLTLEPRTSRGAAIR